MRKIYDRKVILHSQVYLALNAHQLRITCKNNGIFFMFIFRSALNWLLLTAPSLSSMIRAIALFPSPAR